MKTLVCLFMLLAQLTAGAQAPAWQGATGLSAPSPWVLTGASIAASATDAAGMVYLVGVFTDNATFGAIQLTANGSDLFVAKWNPATHAFVWAVRSGNINCSPSSLVVEAGVVYVGGIYSAPSVTFGPTTLTDPLYAAGPPYKGQGFVAKLLDAGSSASWAWAWGTQAADWNVIRGLTLQAGNLYFTGTYGGAVQLDAVTLTNSHPASIGSTQEEGYVAKLTNLVATPTVAWAMPLIGSTFSQCQDIVASAGSLYVVGYFLGSGTLGGVALPAGPSNRPQVILAKLTDTGPAASVVWTELPSPTCQLRGARLAVQGTNLYLAGALVGAPATVGSLTVPNPYLLGGSGGGWQQAYIAKLSDLGTTYAYRWLQLAGGDGVDGVTTLVVKSNAVYVGGSFDSNYFTVGGTVLPNANIVGTHTQIMFTNGDWFVARFLDAGNSASLAWAQKAGSLAHDAVSTLAVVGTEVVVAGITLQPASFAPALAAGTGSGPVALAWLTEANALAAAATAALPGLTLYPNPAHDTTTVRLPASPGPATLTLRDALGRVAHTATAPAGTDYALNLQGLVPGVYALRVQIGEGLAVQKVVVE